MTDLVTLRDICKSYAGAPALRSASLAIAAGEIHALVGENGAGKSTLVKILAGVLHADRADIAIDGKSVAIDSPQSAFDHGLRFIHQELDLVPALSVAENIFLGHPYPRRLGAFVDWDRLIDASRQALALLGIGHIDPRRKMARLGLGDQMLVRISAAFLDRGTSSVRLYVMDEPTASLNGEETKRLFRVLDEIRQSGRSVLYVTHRLDEVMRLCDRVTALRGGEHIATRVIAETSEADIIRDMIGRPIDQAFPPVAAAPSNEIAFSVRDLAGDGLRPVSFDVRHGEIVGVAGLSGAGQSEILRLLMGADRRRSGRVQIDNRDQSTRHPAGAWRAGFAYVPRERRSEGLVLSRPIAENITLPHLNQFAVGGAFVARGRERRFAAERGSEVRLKSRGPRQLCYELSGGNQQKVVFARALAKRPAVLLLDEPTRGVDVGAKYDIYTLIRKASAGGTAILIASSDFPELIGMCDRIIVMRESAISTVLDAVGLTEEDLLNYCYGYETPTAAAGPARREA